MGQNEKINSNSVITIDHDYNGNMVKKNKFESYIWSKMTVFINTYIFAVTAMSRL